MYQLKKTCRASSLLQQTSLNDRTIPVTTNIYIKEWMHKQLKVIFFWMNDTCNSSNTCRIISQTFLSHITYTKSFKQLNENISTIILIYIIIVLQISHIFLDLLSWPTIWIKFHYFHLIQSSIFLVFFSSAPQFVFRYSYLLSPMHLVKPKNEKIKNFLTPHTKFLRLLKGSWTAV